MKETKGDDLSPAQCCSTGQVGDCGPGGAAASCECGPVPARRSWTKTLLSAVVLLGAVGVGAYSLMTSRPPVPPAAANAVAPASPGVNPPPCCAGGANAQAKPTCLGGGAPVPPIAEPVNVNETALVKV